ncbi:peptidylprolyl isomerase [Paenibacillus caui]|uniref:peptidylprolyl isomerase n=1 Tax=Paenibacillus caui TaxID=2873927 RepID=UPI001CA9B516|nr:peptidylprolyl isomerase [Paenibacillus caui]
MKRHITFKLAAFCMLVILAISATGCGSKPNAGQNSNNSGSSSNASSSNASGNASSTQPGNSASPEVKPDPKFSSSDDPIVTIELKSGDKIEIELYPKAAPNTVNNFISLIKKGFYDGTKFHRVIPGFMIQGGDPSGNGTGGPGYSIAGEFIANGIENNLKHTRGVISMARAQDPDSAGSQFFIMVNAANYLDGQYAGFGKVVKGMSTVDAIVNLPRNSDNLPDENDLAVMSKVTVDTKGKDYPEPQIIKNK